MTDPARRTEEEQFLDAASTKRERGLIGEFVGFMAENKAWWMTPILLVLALVGVLLVLGTTAIGPFLYSFF